MGLRSNIRNGNLHTGGVLTESQAAWPWVYVGAHGFNDPGVLDQWWLAHHSEIPTATGGNGPLDVADFLPDADHVDENLITFPISYIGLRFTVNSPLFQNSWTNPSGGNEPVRFRRQADGTPQIDGVPTGGVDRMVVFTLPEGWRPPTVIHQAGASEAAAGSWTIKVNGDCSFVGRPPKNDDLPNATALVPSARRASWESLFAGQPALLVNGWTDNYDYSAALVASYAPWGTGTGYSGGAGGDIIQFLRPDTTIDIFVAEVSNGQSSGSSEPDWTQDAPNVGDSLGDGSYTWFNCGPLIDFPIVNQWLLNQTYSGNTTAVIPLTAPNGHMYVTYPNYTIDTTGGTEPTWPTDGSYVADDGGYWLDMGPVITGLVWEGAVPGSNVGATLDSAYDPIFYAGGNSVVLNGTTDLFDYNSTVWYQIMLPTWIDDPGFSLWFSCDFEAACYIYYPNTAPMGMTPGTVPLDAGIGDVWPTNGMHLMQLLLNNYFDELPCTGAITNGINTFTLANAANPGWYIGADITIVSGGPGGGSDLVTTVTGIAVVGANTVLTLANNAGFSLGATQAYRTSPNRELSGDWTFEGSSFPAGTDGEVGWENADTGADGFVLLESLNGTTPIYVEIAGREGQSGNFTLYWRVQNADGSAGDTSSSLFDF